MTTDTKLAAIKARVRADKDDFAEGYSDQSIRDREYLLEVVQDQENILKALTLPVQLFASTPSDYELYAALAADKADAS
jgi:hypothetical protein